MSIYKAYDIRGIYGQNLKEKTAYSIGRAFITFLNAKRVVVGHDMRSHSIPLMEALIEGMILQGADVIDIGLCSTPMNYYANGNLKADGSIMVTASHNPGEWNGFKLCRQNAIPISGSSGIMDIGELAEKNQFTPAPSPGKRSTYDIASKYTEHIRKFIEFTRKPKIAIDFANAMGIVEFAGFKHDFEIIPLFDQLDGTFPNHEANPLKADTLIPLQEEIKKHNAEFGAAFDGDADRCGFVDETGEIVTMDLITAIIARDILTHGPATILYDLRSSWAVKECILENGGKPVMCRVGHAFIKNQMRECDAVFAGELAGHYYFKENFTAESSALALIMVANVIEKTGKPLSEIVKPLRKYYSSGEINSHIQDARKTMDKIKKIYNHGYIRQFELDGISTEYDDWWFNVRMSNTEPLIRLIVEAKNQQLMEQKRDQLIELIRN